GDRERGGQPELKPPPQVRLPSMASLRPAAQFICRRRLSEITNATFLRNFRRPAGLVSTGRLIRMDRVGASKSKKAARVNGWDGSLTTGGWSGPHRGRSKAHRSTYCPGAI